MHRHGYQGRKFHRENGPRRALIKGLADSLVRDEAIETTLPKAKEMQNENILDVCVVDRTDRERRRAGRS